MEMLLYNNDANQTYSILLSASDIESMSAAAAASSAALAHAHSDSTASQYHYQQHSPLSSGQQLSSMTAHHSNPLLWDFDKLPIPKALLMSSSQLLQQNITQLFNVTNENLTNLISSMDRQQQLQNQLRLNESTPDADPLKRPPMPLLATLTVCYTLIFIAGVLGNLITCIVISRNKFMHTATNFYLFNLAVSDLILLLSGEL